jgi:hypothetical protein
MTLISSAIRADDDGVSATITACWLVGTIGRSIKALTLSEIESALNADDQQWSSTIGYVDLIYSFRVDDDDVSATVTVRFQAVERSAMH